MGQSVKNAVAQRDTSPSGMVGKYRDDFAQVMPSHVNGAGWVRIAQGILRRDAKLAEAARSAPQSLMSALMDAAQQGLTPGTTEFYLVPRKRKGSLEVQGITGYQGEIELIYRAGAVASVVAEIVHENDTFEWIPGKHERPIHEADWFGNRGTMVGAYAYAIMNSGSTSKVVILNQHDIEKARAMSDGADSSYSPWQKWPESMWLKTAAHRLAKWVPTSAEYRHEQERARARSEDTEIPASPDSDVVHAEIVEENDDEQAT